MPASPAGPARAKPAPAELAALAASPLPAAPAHSQKSAAVSHRMQRASRRDVCLLYTSPSPRD
eukprot:11731243-Alexandrium_andersonii.AAC.1